MAFSFSVAALIEGRVDACWARWVRPWVLAAWCFLTIGITLGSAWAYYTLGWGGWWFWDPVENASFMPWLVGTALLHSALVVERRNALMSWTILLGILAFSLSLVGTFLVRSGVLTSVHAFALDPERGVFILAMIVIATGGALTLYALRMPTLVGGSPFAPISRESSLVFNNMLLIVAAGTVFLGTFYPLIIDLLTTDKISVGPPYYNQTFVPIMLPLLVAMAFGPMLKWKRADLSEALVTAQNCRRCQRGGRSVRSYRYTWSSCSCGARDRAGDLARGRLAHRAGSSHTHRACACRDVPEARSLYATLVLRARHRAFRCRIDDSRHRRNVVVGDRACHADASRSGDDVIGL